MKPEVVTEIEGGLLLQLNGTVTDKTGQLVPQSEAKKDKPPATPPPAPKK